MAWTRQGTVAVTNGSNTVTGTNAQFATNALAGDSFIGPDGRNYEIVNIPTENTLALATAYLGPTASGQGYAIMPTEGHIRDSANLFRSYAQQFGAKVAALGTTGNYEILPVTKGGTGAADSAGARKELGLGTASTVNTGTAAGNVMPIQAGAWSAPVGLGLPQSNDLFNMNGRSVEVVQYGPVNGAPVAGAQSLYGVALAIKGSVNEWRNVLQFTTDGEMYLLSITNPSQGGQWRVSKLYTTQNTSRASDGTLKAI